MATATSKPNKWTKYYRTCVLNANFANSKNINQYGRIKVHKMYKPALKKLHQTKHTENQEYDEVDGILWSGKFFFRKSHFKMEFLEGKRPDFESRETIDELLSCTPQCKNCSYSGFPIFLTISTLLQVVPYHTSIFCTDVATINFGL